MKRPLRIGLDLDGVIIDHRPNKLALASELGISLESWQANSNVIRQHLPSEHADAFHEKLYGDMTLTAPPMAEALSRIAALPGEIYIVSARRPLSAPFAAQWLSDNGVHQAIPKDRINFVGSPTEKLPVIERLGIDIFLDDELKVLTLLPGRVRRVFFDPDGLKEKLGVSTDFEIAGDWRSFSALFDLILRD